MSYEILVGLQIKDNNLYSEYRKAMKPLLESFGGGFRHDFEVSRVLKSESGKPINRVFVIYFRDKTAMEQFFSHPEYLKIKTQFFEKSVAATSILAEFVL